MAKKVKFFGLGMAMLCLSAGCISSAFTLFGSPRYEPNPLTITISIPRTQFVLGEMIPLHIRVTNKGDEAKIINGGTVRSGYVRLLVADKAGLFKLYSNSEWGTKKSSPITLGAGEHIDSEASLLWNSNPKGRVADLRQVADKKIVSDFAIDKSGPYAIKAILISSQNRANEVIESNVVQVVVEEPVGKDAELWQAMKANPEIARFIQNRTSRGSTTDSPPPFISELKEMIGAGPDSALVTQIRNSLAIFDVEQQQRRRVLDNARMKTKHQ